MRAGLFGVWQPSPMDSEGRARTWRTDRWSKEMFATFADYLCISPGDKVFFFQDRLLYGIGEVVERPGAPTRRGALLNYTNADLSSPPTEPSEENALYTGPEWRRVRVVVPFAPSPTLWEEGIDMDEVLASPGADDCWGLRFWEGFNFRLLGELETRVLLGIFLRRFDQNRKGLQGVRDHAAIRSTLKAKFVDFPSPRHIVAANPELYLEGSMFRIEECLHAVMAEHLQDNEASWFPPLHDPEKGSVFHEFPASPPKPPQWADEIDLMVTRLRPGVAEAPPTHYSIFEMKRDSVSLRRPESADAQLSQVMRYVDFVARHHAGNNYDAVSAFYVAHHFVVTNQDTLAGTPNSRDVVRRAIQRHYVLNPREKPATRHWDSLRFLTYSWDSTLQGLALQDITGRVVG